jgi:hypothetical protein
LLTVLGVARFKADYATLLDRLKATWNSAGGLHKVFLVVFSLFILVKAAGQVQSVDSGAYHLPFIKWVEQFPAIKGLANVHSRFGFNYHYHVLYAFYGFANVLGATIHAMNGFMYLLGFGYFYSLYHRTGQNMLFRLSAIISLLYISQINKGMTGFSPDLPVAILQMMIVFECLHYALEREQGLLSKPEKNMFVYSIFWLTFGAITLKLATVAVIFVLLIVLFRELLQIRRLVLLAGFAVLIFTPYFVRNYILSGYLVYPFYSVDIFNVPWKIPLARTIDEKVVIKNFALGYDYYYKGEYHYDMAFVKQWLRRMPELNPAYMPVIGTMAVCLLLFIAQWVFSGLKKTNTWKSAENLVLYGLLLGLIFWFYNAPDLRFGNGIILPFIALVLSGYYIRLVRSTNFDRLIGQGFALAITVSSVLSVSGRAISHPALQSNKVDIRLLMQPAYPLPDTSTVLIQNQRTWISPADTFGRCWECPLPCSYPQDSYEFMVPGQLDKGFVAGPKQP